MTILKPVLISLIFLFSLSFISESSSNNTTVCNNDNEFTCKNGQCVDISYECDHEYDCWDESDESHCFFCKNGDEYVYLSDVCDKVDDCSDKSDESCVSCDACFFCDDDAHIHTSKVCNGYYDCKDQTDENNCTNHSCPPNSTTIQCKNSGKCLTIQFQCNGFDDCDDGSDEENEVCKNRINPYEFASRNSFTAIWGLFNMILGTFGNGMTIIAIPYAMLKRRWGLYNNWYTSSIFIVHLAFYDGLFCLFGMLDKIIYNLGYKWPFGSSICILEVKIIPIISQASWYALGCIAVTNACSTICHDRWNAFCTKSKAILIMVCLLVFNMLTSVPQLLEQTKVSYYNDFTGVCEIEDLTILKGVTPTISSVWFKVPQKLAFIMTCGMIFISYFLIWLKMRQSRKSLQEILQGNMKFVNKNDRNQNRLTLTIFLVCACYVIFVLPLMISEFLNGVVSSNIIIGLYWTQYSINFIIYAASRDAFQKAYMDIIDMILPKDHNKSKNLDILMKVSKKNPSKSTDETALSESSRTTNIDISSGIVKSYPSENSPNLHKDGLQKVIQEDTLVQNKNDKKHISFWALNNKKILFVSILVFVTLVVIFCFMGVNNNLNTKLVVIGGYTSGGGIGWQTKSSVHIVDIEKTHVCDVQSVQLKGYIGTTTKSEFKNLPDELIGSTGSLINGTVVICGGLTGSDITNKCYKMVNQNHWGNVANMSIGREYHAMTAVNNEIFVAGGWDADEEYTDTVEVLSDLTSTSWSAGGKMPHPIAGHCLVTLNNTNIMSIGGIDRNCQSLNETWIYNIKTKIWKAGEPMLSPRYYPGCGLIKDKNGNSFVIVAGGEVGRYCLNDVDGWVYNATLTATVELFDPLTHVWSKFDDLPRKISGSQLIEDGSGGVLMVGGDDKGNFEGHTPDILYLSGTDSTWKTTFKTIEVSSAHHVAMLIPDSFVEC